MSILFARERRAGQLTAAELILRDRGGGRTSSGVTVTTEQAERHSAVWASRAAIAEAVQQLPVEEVRTKGGKTVRRSPDSSLFYDPHPGWTWEAWIWAQVWALAGCGRTYGYVNETGRDGFPTSMLPVEPQCVQWRWNRGTWEHRLEGEKVSLWPLGPLWHVPLYATAANPEGMSPIAYHAESIGVGLAAQKYVGGFFGDGGHPTYIWKGKDGTPDPGEEGAARLKALWLRVLQAGSGREPIVVPPGWDMEQVSVSPAETQFLETMRYSGEDVARVFGVPAEKIGLAVSGQSVTYSNVPDRNAEWRVGGLSRYVRALEASLSRLVPDGAKRVLRFNFDEFLRADPAGRFAAYKTSAEVGSLAGTPVMTVNEMRAAEGLEPLPGGDVFVRPKQEPTTQRSEQLELEIGGR